MAVKAAAHLRRLHGQRFSSFHDLDTAGRHILRTAFYVRRDQTDYNPALPAPKAHELPKLLACPWLLYERGTGFARSCKDADRVPKYEFFEAGQSAKAVIGIRYERFAGPRIPIRLRLLSGCHSDRESSRRDLESDAFVQVGRDARILTVIGAPFESSSGSGYVRANRAKS